MISIYLECAATGQDALIAELYDRGTLGILELGSGVRAWFDDGADLYDLIESYDGHVMADDEEDWVGRTEQSFPPLEIGERFWLVPPWNADPPPAGRVRLEINPGLACGTGWHACTQMCLEALERYVRPGDWVFDVGTGSGILTAAAALLGAGYTAACDVDYDAVTIARDRIGPRVFQGSADAVAIARFDVIVANISAPVVEALRPEFRGILRPSGTLILSGFPEIAPIPGTVELLAKDGWQCVVVRPE